LPAAADFEDVEIGIARTGVDLDGGARVREIEHLIVAAIAAARRSILIESQYLTAGAVGEALARRLAEPHAPEVIAVLPQHQRGWLEQGSMGVLRRQMLSRLRAADRYGRLGVYYPRIPGLGDDECVNVHSKLLIIDDRLLKIGSSNLSNRSMNLDTECDLAIDAMARSQDNERVRAAIRGVSHRVLGEHLATPPERIAAELAAGMTMRSVIERRLETERCLSPLREMSEPPVDLTLLSGALTDPERPMDAAGFAEQFLVAEVPGKLQRFVRHAGASKLAAAVLGAASIALAIGLRRARPARRAA
jgi:phospholipase D1/2